MNELHCRLLPFAVADGPWQMAADEAMLEAAVAGCASFRLYGWSAATLSLGYFQPAAIRRTDPLLASLPYVRRASGGATLVHDREITYALALPSGPPWQRHGDSWVRRIHALLRDVFASFGVATRLCEGERKLGGTLCFRHHTPEDMLLGDAKIAGSAQRKRRGALLQHGGVLLAQSRHAPALLGVAELTGITISSTDFGAALLAGFESQTGMCCRPGDWTGVERQRIDELVATKYSHPAWNDKR